MGFWENFQAGMIGSLAANREANQLRGEMQGLRLEVRSLSEQGRDFQERSSADAFDQAALRRRDEERLAKDRKQRDDEYNRYADLDDIEREEIQTQYDLLIIGGIRHMAAYAPLIERWDPRRLRETIDPTAIEDLPGTVGPDGVGLFTLVERHPWLEWWQDHNRWEGGELPAWADALHEGDHHCFEFEQALREILWLVEDDDGEPIPFDRVAGVLSDYGESVGHYARFLADAPESIRRSAVRSGQQAVVSEIARAVKIAQKIEAYAQARAQRRADAVVPPPAWLARSEP